MKFFITLFLAFAFSLNISAQSWAPDGATWHYTLNWLSATDYGYNSYTVQGDSTINGITCSRLLRHTYSCNYRPEKEFMYMDSNKVYYWNALNNDFTLLYDFGAQVGDSYEMPVVETWFPSPPYDTFTVTVDSIYMLNINGQARQVQAVHQTSKLNPNWTITHNIIEGIGSDIQMFVWDGSSCDVQWDRGLRCYQDSILGLYETGIVDSCEETFTATGLADRVGELFDLYPNPSQDKIQWSGIEGSHFAITIWSLDGKMVKKAEVDENMTSLHGLPSGIYYIEVEAENGIKYHSKFLKTDQ